LVSKRALISSLQIAQPMIGSLPSFLINSIQTFLPAHSSQSSSISLTLWTSGLKHEIRLHLLQAIFYYLKIYMIFFFFLIQKWKIKKKKFKNYINIYINLILYRYYLNIYIFTLYLGANVLSKTIVPSQLSSGHSNKPLFCKESWQFGLVHLLQLITI